METSRQRPACYDDILKLPEHLVGEIIDGSLVTHRRPPPRHAFTLTRLTGEVFGRFDMKKGEPGGWWILREVEFHFGPQVLVPDISGWRHKRLARLPDAGWMELAPEWVCEVLSPSTARVDRVQKLPIYAAAGVGHVWLVDPVLRTLEAFENQQGRWLLLGAFKNDDAVAIAPFEAVALELGALWAD